MNNVRVKRTGLFCFAFLCPSASDILFVVFQAWSSIVYQLIPNVKQLEANLTQFGDIIDADEVLLFERATFLVSIIISQDPKHGNITKFVAIMYRKYTF